MANLLAFILFTSSAINAANFAADGSPKSLGFAVWTFGIAIIVCFLMIEPSDKK